MNKFILLLIIIAIVTFLPFKLEAADCSNARAGGSGLTCSVSGIQSYCASGTTFCDCARYGTAQQIHCTQGAYYYGLCVFSSGPEVASWGYCTRNVDATYPNGGTCTCCTPISCSCTPSCPAGASTTYSGPLCAAGNASCSQSNSCSSCTSTGSACYYPETNTTFIQSNGSTSGPTSVNMVVDGKTYILSTDPNNPTHIKLPALGSSNVQITTPTFTAPVTSRGANYYYQANNYGSSNEWKTWTTCSGIAGEDFCTTMPNSNNTQSFVPTSKTVNQVLKEGATGEISAMYATTDKCNNTYKYSLPIKGYYIVDTLPDSQPNEGGSEIVNPEDLFSDIGLNTTANGCSSLTYSGVEANNELHIKADVTDIDDLNEIQALTLWFTKDTNVPTTETISASYTGSITEDLGIMIKKNGGDWSNPTIYATNANLSWGEISLTDGKGYINVAGSNIIEIYDISVTQDLNATFDYKIKFLRNASTLSGMYNVYGGSLDTYMINGNIIDQSYFVKFFDWGVDLENPTVEDITQQIRDSQNTYIIWGNADSISGIAQTVINAYRLGGVSTDPEGVKLYLPAAYTILKGAITLDPNASIPDTINIGRYNDTNAWVFSNNTGEQDLINIGNNESGQIALYITAYDKACNMSGNSADIDLNPWFASRGATVYSKGNISTTTKDVLNLPSLNGVFNPKTGMNTTLIDLGSELLATRNISISNIIHPSSGAVLATEVEDSNNTKGNWYAHLLEKFNRYKSELTPFAKVVTDDSVSDSCTGKNCYMYSIEDITIPQGYTCDRSTLFITEGNIHINPDVNSDNNLLSGCIFLAKNNIYIEAGRFKSTGTKILYDYIEGYMIADNQIIFTVADESRALRDGVEIFGGMVGLATSDNKGILIQRNLRLYSQINPTVVLTYDTKYPSISTIFFGTEYSLYKQEVGFKTF